MTANLAYLTPPTLCVASNLKIQVPLPGLAGKVRTGTRSKVTDHTRRRLVLGGVPQDSPHLLAVSFPVPTKSLARMPQGSRAGTGALGRSPVLEQLRGAQSCRALSTTRRGRGLLQGGVRGRSQSARVFKSLRKTQHGTTPLRPAEGSHHSPAQTSGSEVEEGKRGVCVCVCLSRGRRGPQKLGVEGTNETFSVIRGAPPHPPQGANNHLDPQDSSPRPGEFKI